MVLTFDLLLRAVRSSGAVVRPLAARRSPTEEFLAAVGFDVYIFFLSLYYCEHSAY